MNHRHDETPKSEHIHGPKPSCFSPKGHEHPVCTLCDFFTQCENAKIEDWMPLPTMLRESELCRERR